MHWWPGWARSPFRLGSGSDGSGGDARHVRRGSFAATDPMGYNPCMTAEGGAGTAAPSESDERFLGIYLNDHWAGQAAGKSLARRILGSNRESALGAYLNELLSELE